MESVRPGRRAVAAVLGAHFDGGQRQFGRERVRAFEFQAVGRLLQHFGWRATGQQSCGDTPDGNRQHAVDGLAAALDLVLEPGLRGIPGHPGQHQPDDRAQQTGAKGKSSQGPAIGQHLKGDRFQLVTRPPAAGIPVIWGPAPAGFWPLSTVYISASTPAFSWRG